MKKLSLLLTISLSTSLFAVEKFSNATKTSWNLEIVNDGRTKTYSDGGINHFFNKKIKHD